MRKINFARGASFIMGLMTSICAAAAVPATPEVEGFLSYTGDSFIAYWGLTDNASSYLLNVFSTAPEEQTSTVGFTQGSAPLHWTCQSSGVHRYTDGKDYMLLKADGDGVYFQNPDGVIDDLVFSGLSIGFDADGVTGDNCCTVRVEVFENSGKRAGYFDTKGYLFTMFPSLSVREVFGQAWPENVCGVRFTLLRTADQPYGEIALLSATYSSKERKFIKRNYETSNNMEYIDGLDPEEVYYYYVTAKNDEGVSNPSHIVTVDGFLPTAATYHGEVTETSYKAIWEPVAKATGYYLNHYRLDPKEGASGSVNVLDETFANAAAGTIDNPVSVESLEGMTDNPGWGGATLIVAPGMVGAGAGRRGSAYLETPRFDASADEGRYQVYIKAKGTPGDKLNIIRQNKYEWVNGIPTAIIHTVVFGTDGWIEEVIDMADGDGDTYMSLEDIGADGSTQNPFLVDEFTASVKSANGGYAQRFLGRNFVEGKDATSYSFTGLDAGCRYGFEVEAAKLSLRGEEMYGEKSPLHEVQLLGDAAVDLPGCDGSVSWADGRLTANLTAAAEVCVHDLGGRSLFTAMLPAGVSVTEVQLPSGVYLVRVGKFVAKIAVR